MNGSRYVIYKVAIIYRVNNDGWYKCMEIIKIDSVGDYINSIKKLIEQHESVAEIYSRTEYLFRGQSSEEYELIPSLGRLGAGQSDIYFAERNMISMAKRKMPNVFTNDMQPLELLGTLQHYGIPTRLLDITENALVALYFACVGDKEKAKNGEVFIFKNDIYDVSTYPMDLAIAESYKYAKPSNWSLKLFYTEVTKQVYFDEQRASIDCEDDIKGALWVERCCANPIFTYAPYRLTRQLIQSGRYIIFPNKIEHVSDTEPGMFLSRIESIDKASDCVVGRMVIPSEKKDDLLKELRMLGIDKSVLFADSVDIVCEEIKKKYFR